jgi:hypothetical protein
MSEDENSLKMLFLENLEINFLLFIESFKPWFVGTTPS